MPESLSLNSSLARHYGLEAPKQLHINQMLADVSNGKLSLRRLTGLAAEAGLQKTPPHTYGVWEDGVAADQPNWVFTLWEGSIDERIIARVMESDFKRNGAPEQFAKLVAHERARQASMAKADAEKLAAREDEMMAIGRLSKEKSTFTHRINGEKFIIGDTVRRARKQV